MNKRPLPIPSIHPNNPLKSTTLLLRQQPPQTKIINHILDLLNLILNPIAPLPERIILEIQNLKPGMHILDKPRNLYRPSIIPQRDRIPGQPRQLIQQRNQTLQVLLDGEVEGIAILEIHGHAEEFSHLLESEELAAGGVEAAQVAAEEDAED